MPEHRLISVQIECARQRIAGVDEDLVVRETVRSRTLGYGSRHRCAETAVIAVSERIYECIESIPWSGPELPKLQKNPVVTHARRAGVDVVAGRTVRTPRRGEH